MKKALFILMFLTIFSFTLTAQAPPPPPATGNSGGTNGTVGGNDAPLDDGLTMALVIIFGFGSWKFSVWFSDNHSGTENTQEH
jgi:hypothetical protein